MCIVAIKPAGVKRPTNNQLKAMCENNPHGFGFMTWNKKDGLVVRKTMDYKTYKKWVTKIPDSQPVVYHARIATHGSVGESNCHPFLSDDKQWAFAHNGVLSIQNEGDMTDSETFFKRLALPLLKAGYKPNDKGVFDKMVATILGCSKFVFMDSNGNIYTYGSFIREGDLLFSNTSYVDYSFFGIGKGKKKSKQQTWDDFIADDDCYMDEYSGIECFDQLVDKLYIDMENDPTFYEKEMGDLYDKYSKEFPVTYDEFLEAYDYAQLFI